MAWGSLGDLEFEPIGGPTDFGSTQGVDWAQHPIINSKPRVQAVGDQLEEIKLQIRFGTPINEDPEGSLLTLLDHMRQREVVALVIGSTPNRGIHAGNFVIKAIVQKGKEFWPNGLIRLVDVEVDLLEWVETPELQVSLRTAPAIRPRSTGKTKPSTQAYTRSEDRQIVPKGAQ